MKTRRPASIQISIAIALGLISLVTVLQIPGRSFEDECSLFVLRQARDGGTPFMIFGKNRDRPTRWVDGQPTGIAEGQRIASYQTRSGTRVVGLKTAGARITVGANSAGLAAAINMAPGRRAVKFHDIDSFCSRSMELAKSGAFFIPRGASKIDAQGALEAYSTVEELAARVRAGRHRAHKLLMAADCHGGVGVFEFASIRFQLPSGKDLVRRVVTCRVWKPGENHVKLLRTNHFLLPGTIKLNGRTKKSSSSRPRLKRLRALTRGAGAGFQNARAILSDHQGYPAKSICNHKVEVPGSISGGRTVSSACMEVPAKGEPWRCRFLIGYPCEGGAWIEPGEFERGQDEPAKPIR